MLVVIKHTQFVNVMMSMFVRRASRDFCKYIHSVHMWSSYIDLIGHRKAVNAAEFHPVDVNCVASCSNDNILRVWSHIDDPERRNDPQILQSHTKAVSDLCWSVDGMHAYSVSDDMLLKQWDVESSSCIRTYTGHASYVVCVDRHPWDTIVASGSFDETVILWDVRAGRQLRCLPAHSDPVTSLDFVFDGTLLATGSHDGLVRLWDVGSGKCLLTLLQDITCPIACVSFTPNGKYLLVGTLNNELLLWDYKKNRIVKRYKGHLTNQYNVMCLSMQIDENAALLTGSEDGRVVCYDIQANVVKQWNAHTGAVVGVSAFKGGKSLVTTSLDDSENLRVWK